MMRQQQPFQQGQNVAPITNLKRTYFISFMCLCGFSIVFMIIGSSVLSWSCAHSMGIDFCPQFYEQTALLVDAEYSTDYDGNYRSHVERRRLRGGSSGSNSHSESEEPEEKTWVIFGWKGSTFSIYNASIQKYKYKNYTGGLYCIAEGQYPATKDFDWWKERIGSNFTIYVHEPGCPEDASDWSKPQEEGDNECHCITSGEGAIRYVIGVVFLSAFAIFFVSSSIPLYMYQITPALNKIAVVENDPSMYQQQQQMVWQPQQQQQMQMQMQPQVQQNAFGPPTQFDQQPFGQPKQQQQMQVQPMQVQMQYSSVPVPVAQVVTYDQQPQFQSESNGGAVRRF